MRQRGTPVRKRREAEVEKGMTMRRTRKGIYLMAALEGRKDLSLNQKKPNLKLARTVQNQEKNRSTDLTLK